MAIKDLQAADPKLGLATISHIKTSLDRLFGKGEWVTWEPETISLELGIEMDDLLLEKIHVLQILEQVPWMFFDNPTFMLYVTEVINDNVADFGYVPAPTSLELAFAISEIKKVMLANGVTPVFDEGIIKATAWILRNEGYSEPIAPFDFVPKTLLEPGQTKNDTADKEQAITTYLKHMEHTKDVDSTKDAGPVQ